MNIKTKLIEQVGFDQAIGRDKLNQLIDLTIAQCMDTLKETPLTHCYTTFDHQAAQGTVQRCLDHLRDQFDI